ncbi:rhodanese-like domain-containing protein [Engelhardtia mirabilis]
MIQSIRPTELKARLDGGDQLVLLDVRQPEEVEICQIEGALNIPLDQLASRSAELDPEAEIVCICHHGMRSANAAAFLLERDFERLINLTGGIDGWAATVDPDMARY